LDPTPPVIRCGCKAQKQNRELSEGSLAQTVLGINSAEASDIFGEAKMSHTGRNLTGTVNLNRAYKSQQYDIAPSTGTGHQLEALEMPYS
jgi:hypothetical protein